MYRDKLYKVELELRDLLEEAWRDGYYQGYQKRDAEIEYNLDRALTKVYGTTGR